MTTRAREIGHHLHTVALLLAHLDADDAEYLTAQVAAALLEELPELPLPRWATGLVRWWIRRRARRLVRRALRSLPRAVRVGRLTQANASASDRLRR